MRDKAVLKKLPYKYLIALCVIGLVSVVIIAFALYSIYDYRRECQQIAGREAEYKVSRIATQMDEKLENMRQYYITSVENDEIVWFLENDLHYSDYSYYKNAYDTLACAKLFGGYVGGFTFANFDTGWVLNNKGLFPMTETANSDVLYGLFEEKHDGIGKSYWVYDRTVAIENTIDRNYRVTVEADGLSLVMKLPLAKLNSHALLIANINMGRFRSDLSDWVEDHEALVVVAPDGKVISSTDMKLEESSLKLLASGGALDDAQKLDVPGYGSYMVRGAESGILGWKYYVYYDLDKGQFPTMRFSWIYLSILFVLVVAGFYVVITLLYRPINLLMKGVSDTGQKITGNEIDYLAHKFADLKDDKLLLEQVMNQQQDKLLELFELRLIRGEVRSKDEWNEYFEELDLKAGKYFATAVMVMDLRREDEAHSNVNEDAICLKIVEDLPDEIKKLAWMPPVYNACTIFGIFSNDSEEELLNCITEFYNKMQKYVEEEYGYQILMGVSTSHTEFHHIRAAYRESVNALTMQSSWSGEPEEKDAVEGTLQSDEKCRFYLASTTMGSSSYNNSFEKDIQTAIKAMDKVQCYKVVDEFSLLLSGMEVHDKAFVYILRFVNTIMLTAIDAEVDLDKIYPDGLKKAYQELSEVIEPARVRRYIKYMFVDRILQARTELLEDSAYSMMEGIEKIIADSKGNITLTECADALGVHQTYIWKILKMEKGKSFSDYLEEYKLNEAKRMLLQTDMTVAEIAAELNYTNAQNFIRFFSKGTGVTPGKFRKLY
ncbi:MAG: helix-turn-helix transcriptional regulator [Lachnospiraceae bacterium]|nr:helix-turn-helix transcriptional regulator [Lachnospiraceae bacterium]